LSNFYFFQVDLPNCWRSIFLILPKLDGCQVDLPNCWSCSHKLGTDRSLKFSVSRGSCVGSFGLVSVNTEQQTGRGAQRGCVGCCYCLPRGGLPEDEGTSAPRRGQTVARQRRDGREGTASGGDGAARRRGWAVARAGTRPLPPSSGDDMVAVVARLGWRMGGCASMRCAGLLRRQSGMADGRLCEHKVRRALPLQSQTRGGGAR
jgi:hypothetical protein